MSIPTTAEEILRTPQKLRQQIWFRVHAIAQALSGDVIVIYLFTRLLSRDLSCHLLV